MPIRGVQLNFKNLVVTVDKEKTILKDVNGYALPGQLLAIMGPSGSGKTTLLNVLAGRGTGTMTGSILMNNTPLNKKLKRNIAFVLQDDILFENLTLRETLTYTALLKLPSEMPHAQKIQKVDDIVDTMDIRKCIDTKIGGSLNRGLSGGEKKRVNIGSELLNDPSILLLDEPTSGLDSATACSLVEVLKKYASHNRKTVVTSIHQPSSQIFYQFDRLILLSEGEIVYFGAAHAVMDYFASINLHCYIPHYNAADFILDKVKGSKEDLAIVHNAASKQSWRSVPTSRLSRQASEQLQQTIQNSKVCSSKDEAAPSDKHTVADYEFVALDMVGGSQSEESISNNNQITPDIVPSINTLHMTSANCSDIEQLNLPDKEQKCTCHLGDSIDKNDTLPWCEVCIATASPTKENNALQDIDLNKRWPTTWFEQLSVLTVRAFKQSRSLFLKQVDMVRHAFLAVVFGLLYFQLSHTEERLHDIRGLWFTGLLYWGMEPCFSTITLFPGERVVIDKERSSGTYRLSAYYLAKMISEIPLLIIFPTVHMTVWYWMAGLNSFIGAFLTQWVILIANGLVGQSVGLAISAFSSDFRIALLLMDVWAITSLMLGGFFVETVPFWLGWLQYFSNLFYIFNLHLRVEFNMRGGPVKCLEEKSIFEACHHGNATHVDGNTVLDSLDVLDVPVWASITAIIVYIVFFRLLAYLILKYKYKPK